MGKEVWQKSCGTSLEEGHTRFYAGFWDTERGEDLCLLTEEELGKEVGGLEIRM